MNAPDRSQLLTMSPQEVSTDVLIEKYAKGSESSIGEIHARVARALAEVEPQELREAAEVDFKWALENGFVPAGRIASAAGTDIKATLINCFVQPVGDSVSEYKNGKPGIYTAVAEAAETMRRGGGVGYDFSQIRPAGALVAGTQSNASGPVSFMKVFDSSCETVESAGARRGAQMGVLRCNHPDIEKFIAAKDKGDLKNFNLSIGVTDEFMETVQAGGMVELIHAAMPSKGALEKGAYQRDDGMWVYNKLPAAKLWDSVMRSTYDHAEPGILFISRMNTENNLWYCETIEATNPCAEQPLPDYGCCCLGSVDLTRFVQAPFSEAPTFDFKAFASVCRIAVRMLDNVLDATFWPLEKQKQEAANKRRIGLGFLGIGSALVMLGLRYDSVEGRAMASKISESMRDEAYLASIELAKTKGAFPLLESAKYLQSGFATRLPKPIRAAIAKHGLRNSHLLSIAPTGTITLAFADNASNGIEPAFSWTYDRKKRMADGSFRMYECADHAWRLYRHLGNDMNNLPSQFVTALEMSADDHMLMMQAVQPFIDTAISKTVNIPADYPYADFQDLYLNAWKAGLKGLATYRPNSTLGSVLSVGVAAVVPVVVAASDSVVAEEDPLRRQFETREAGELESVTEKVEMWGPEGKKSMYLIASFMPVTGVIGGAEVTIERPVEFFLAGGQRDDGQQWLDSNMRQLSLMARSGGPLAKALENMRDITWDKGAVRSGYLVREDGTKIPRFHDSEVAAIGFAVQQILFRRGFLTATGGQVPSRVLAKLAAKKSLPVEVAEIASVPEVAVKAVSAHFAQGTGAKCPECGGHDMHHIDGCTKCMNCGHIGACG